MKTDITPVVNTLFWVSWALFLFTFFQIGKYEDGPPENLRNAAKVLKNHYEDDLDDPQFAGIWQELDSKLDSYASGLEARRRDFQIQYWFAIIFYPAVAFVSFFVRKNHRPNKSAMDKPDPVSS